MHLCISKLNETSDLYRGVIRKDKGSHTLSCNEVYKIMNVFNKVQVYLLEVPRHFI